MQYIIDDATLVSDSGAKSVSIYVKDREILQIGTHFAHHNAMRVDVRPFVLTPQHVLYDPDGPKGNFSLCKEYYIRHYLLKGAGAVLTFFEVEYEYQLDQRIRDKRKSLLNCPIDFLIGLKISPKTLTTSLLRKCKALRIPVIFIEFDSMGDLSELPWGWYREVCFPYNPLFIPYMPPEGHYRDKVKVLKKWTNLLQSQKIHHHPSPLSYKAPIGLAVLKKIGLYPKRGILRPGGEISYNLYFKNSIFEQGLAIDYDSQRPAVTVQNGHITSVDGQAFFRPGFGQEIRIEKTALFL
ncbi:MAG TPA: hypothetical protein VIG80_06170 [Bacillaceae bacterium]